MRRVSLWQAVWIVVVVAGHAALAPHIKSGPQGFELALLVGYGVLVATCMRETELRTGPTKLEAVWRIGLAALETAVSVACLTFAALIAIWPARTADGHRTMPTGHAELALLAFVIAGIGAIVLLVRSGARAVQATRIALAGCAVATVVAMIWF